MKQAKKKSKNNLNKSDNFKIYAKEIGLFIADILYNAVIIIVLVVLIRSFLISPFRVIGTSMADTLENNEFIIIDKLSYNIGHPERGNTIVFLPPITNKYPYKFEESIITNNEGTGTLSFKGLSTTKSVVYCKNKLISNFWFCKEGVRENDLVYYHPIQEDSWNKNMESIWQNSEKKLVTSEEIENGSLTINGDPNQSYSLRIYSSRGPEYFVKRIIGIPGDEVKIDNGKTYLKTPDAEDFIEINESYLNQENANHTYFNQKLSTNTFIVPKDKYFVLGDNRNHSNDSRSWFSPIKQDPTPFVSLENISGKVLVVLWPLSDIRFIHSK